MEADALLVLLSELLMLVRLLLRAMYKGEDMLSCCLLSAVAHAVTKTQKRKEMRLAPCLPMLVLLVLLAASTHARQYIPAIHTISGQYIEGER